MQYNVLEIIDNEITLVELKEIINKKLYKIIELVEFDSNTN